jgi:hypothetical protein
MRGSKVRETEAHVPSYVVGREAILRASCFADSIRRNGFDIEEIERKPKIHRILRHLQISEAAAKLRFSDWLLVDPRVAGSLGRHLPFWTISTTSIRIYIYIDLYIAIGVAVDQ